MFLNDFVQKCHLNLLQPASKLPLAYLVSRGVTLEEIKKHKVGFLGRSCENVAASGTEEELFNKWLGYRGKFVAHRLVFPIYNELGEIKGIETRGLDRRSLEKDLLPKFKASLKETVALLPESTVRYKKFYLQKERFSPFFFGIPSSLEPIWTSREVFLTEGIFDAISLLKIYPNCISTLTANINEYQINWLKRYVAKVYVLFDGDKKGREASNKIVETLGQEMCVYSIGIPSKSKDLNEFLITNGVKDLKMLLNEKLKTLY